MGGNKRMEVTKEDLNSLVKTLDMNIKGLRNNEVDQQIRISIAILSLEALKHNIQNNMHRMKEY